MTSSLGYVLILATLAAGHAVPPRIVADDSVLPAGFREDLRTSLETGTAGSLVQEVSQVLSLPSLFFDENETRPPSSPARSAVFCSACRIGFDTVLSLLDGGASMDMVFNATVEVCIDLNISSPIVCQNMIEIAKPQLAYILTNKELSAQDICGTVFVSQDCHTNNPDRDWVVVLPPTTKPPVVSPVIPQDAPVLKVLHLADTHYDLEYLPGSNAVCVDMYFCCHEESGEVLNPEDAAGFWGDYRQCDSPRWTLEALYSHIVDTHPDISFVIWTGDLVPHNVWNTSREHNLLTIRSAVQMIQDYFPDTPVFPALGNHEADPVNAFPPPYMDNEFDISWLYDELAILWQTWLPTDVAQTIMYSAYYSVEVFSGLRLLSLNTISCYGYNWWLLYDEVDPGEGLMWLANELQRAEDDGVLVYLIGHIPSGHDDCTYTWSHQYNRIIARYEGVIAGIFYGHTHKDHFQIFFDPDDPTRTTNVAFVGQSQTTYHDLNPGYKVYSVDGVRQDATYQVMDHQNWYFDLDSANVEGGTPNIELLYTAKDAYNMPDLSSQSHLDLIREMSLDNSTKFDLFFRNYIKAGRPYLEEGCDAECKSKILCRLLVSDTSNRSICDVVLGRK